MKVKWKQVWDIGAVRRFQLVGGGRVLADLYSSPTGLRVVDETVDGGWDSYQTPLTQKERESQMRRIREEVIARHKDRADQV